MANREFGTVKWFNDEKGLGFIKPESGGDDIYVHFARLRSPPSCTLADGQRVAFRSEIGPNGPQATEISGL